MSFFFGFFFSLPLLSRLPIAFSSHCGDVPKNLVGPVVRRVSASCQFVLGRCKIPRGGLILLRKKTRRQRRSRGLLIGEFRKCEPLANVSCEGDEANQYSNSREHSTAGEDEKSSGYRKQESCPFTRSRRPFPSPNHIRERRTAEKNKGPCGTHQSSQRAKEGNNSMRLVWQGEHPEQTCKRHEIAGRYLSAE
jgi:hypothetical protein